MPRVLALVYGLVCYVAFLAAFLYAIWFMYTMDRLSAPPGSPWLQALIVDALLLSVFALQHSIMARQSFKRAWTKIIPKPIERSTYVLFSNLALLLMYLFWRPLPGVIWDVQSPAGQIILRALFVLGWLTVLVATFLISHFELFGLKQVWSYFQNQQFEPPRFATPGFYKFVRHPI